MSVQHRQRATVSPLTLLAIIGAALLFLNRVLVLLASPAGHDQSWYLLAAQRLLSGATLYGPRLSETNPPLIIWFSAIPVLLARLIHSSPAFALYLTVLAMILLSSVWSVRLLRLRTSYAKGLPLFLAACAIAFVELDISPDDFGQREQLLVILVVPYILAATIGAINRLSIAERCALGVAAGLAVCLKPQQLLIIVGLELFLAISARSIRRAIAPEILSMLLTGGLYVLLVRFLTPLYMQKTVPLLFETYWAYRTIPALALAGAQWSLLLLALAALATCFVYRKVLHDPATTTGLIVCSFASSIAFDIQHAGWDYQRFPSREFFLLALFYLMIDILRPIIDRSPRLSMRFAIVSVGLIAISLSALAVRLYRRPPVEHNELDDFFAQYKPNTTVYVFATTVEPFSSVFNHDLNWGSRFPALWMLPAIVQNEEVQANPPALFKRIPPPMLSRLSTLQRNDTTHDLNFWKPSVILVAHCKVEGLCQALEGRNFDMISWFLQNRGFADAWSHYQKSQSLPSYDVYTRVR